MEFIAAQWIWDAGEPAPRNAWLRFRRSLRCPRRLRRGALLITADSRYELFVNDVWIGSGPVRSFPWAYHYDRYDVTPWLHAGAQNVLAVRVVQWGDHTFQSIRARGGLLCELILQTEDGALTRVASDERWLVAPDTAIVRHTPRIAPQLGFEEQYDARRAEDGWPAPGFAAAGWASARTIGPPGTPPWTTLVPRPIPFLTRDEVTPVRLLALEMARPRPGYRWAFDLRHRLDAAARGLNAAPVGAREQAFVTEVVAPRPCAVALFLAAGYTSIRAACNGTPLATFPARLELRTGRNLFAVAGTEWPSLLFETEEHLEFDARRLVPFDDSQPAWAYLVEIDERDETVALVLAARDPRELPPAARHAVAGAESMEDIHLLTSTQRFLLPAGGFCDPSVDGPQPRERLAGPRPPLIDDAPALLHHTATPATLHPQPDGDLHLVVDFGREIVGYLVLEIDAPAGTVVDANLFEGIDDTGIYWTERLRNSFRYTCRAGYQTFRSRVRRGFRYVSLTVRAEDGPVRLYNVRCLLSTYPVEERGRFSCSDATLTRIWAVAAETLRLCMEDTYVDCPAYEQVFWVGDARIEALANAAAFGAFALTDHCLRLTAHSLSREVDRLRPPHLRARSHLTTAHVVSGWATEIPMWSLLWIWSVWEHYLLSGDRASLAALYPAVRECLARCLDALTLRGLMDIPDAWNLVDWAAMDLTRDGEVTANNALLVESLRRAALMADALAAGSAAAQHVRFSAAAAGYRAAAERVYAAINAWCWSERHGAYVDTVRDEAAHARYAAEAARRGEQPEPRATFLARTRVSEPTNTLVLLCGCAPPERIGRLLPLVRHAITGAFVGSDPDRAPAWPPERVVPVGSPWFLSFTLETLLAHDEIEPAVGLVREQWGRMLSRGATTFWETFAGSFSGGHWSRSLCHGWSAAPAYILSTTVLGVKPAAPGYARVRIAPHPCGLDWAAGVVPTPRGDVHVRWERTGIGLEMDIALPPETPGELVAPRGMGPPQPAAGPTGALRQEQGLWHVALPPGARARYLMPDAAC